MLRVALILALINVVAGLDTRTIMDYLKSNGQFSVLVQLLQDTHLDGVLDAPGATFTMFAPTDAAFARMEPGLLDYVKANPRLFQRVLMGHVMDSAFISLSMQNERTEKSLDGDVLRFNIYDSGNVYTVSGAVITNGDIVLKNGVLHVISDVILPPEGDILRQILVDDQEFEDLAAALALTSLLDEMELEAITLFAPVNSAFVKQFPTTQDIPTDTNQLKAVLLNHVVNGTYYKSGLQDGMVLTTLAGNPLRISRTGTQVSVNGHPIDGDIFATNGIIHVMNDVLVPSGN